MGCLERFTRTFPLQGEAYMLRCLSKETRVDLRQRNAAAALELGEGVAGADRRRRLLLDSLGSRQRHRRRPRVRGIDLEAKPWRLLGDPLRRRRGEARRAGRRGLRRRGPGEAAVSSQPFVSRAERRSHENGGSAQWSGHASSRGGRRRPARTRSKACRRTSFDRCARCLEDDTYGVDVRSYSALSATFWTTRCAGASAEAAAGCAADSRQSKSFEATHA